MIGRGVYTVSEAASYAGIPVQTARSWFLGRSDGGGKGPIFNSEYERVNGHYELGFLNLIEAHVARRFREEGVKNSVIRRAHEILKRELDLPHPFARADLATDGKSVIMEKGDEDLIDVISRQHFFPKMKLGKIAYSELTKLAESWNIADGVVIASAVNFGKPVVKGTGVSTRLVADQYVANRRNAELVARMFRVDSNDVVLAFEFERGLGRVAA